jgi:uridine kinase
LKILHSDKPYLVGIVGGSASGKTSFIKHLSMAFDEDQLCVISQDHYYIPREQQQRDEQGHLNFDLPSSIDRERFFQDLVKLASGEEIFVEEYTFNNPNKTPELIRYKPAPIIIMEGLFIFHYTEILDMLDLKVYLHADEEIKLKRRIFRDATERGYPEETVLYQWHNHVMPAYKQYLEPYKAYSDIVINNNVTYDKGLEVLVNHLKSKVQWKINLV